ncbi:unnamed protein product [Caenorhabditis bovis]|uniref:Chromatin target of PRMT1 protein C-terminal domain-containing protein n=1 Tax=Caenorhabditis bovis TaxID=2654633 RepID=A0A8S1F734_9PELO|nr:unnamed protein product [Caenorhabditis bovis]
MQSTSGVPSKIVILGNSKMSLNERFGSLPKPIVVKKRPRTIQRPAQKIIQEIYEEEIPIQYVQKPIRRFRQPQQFRHVPIENRLSIVRPLKTVPQRHFVNRFHPSNKTHYRNYGPHNQKPFNKRQPQVFTRNPRFKKPNQQAKAPISKKTVEQLDRELDEYMKRSKHTPIRMDF